MEASLSQCRVHGIYRHRASASRGCNRSDERWQWLVRYHMMATGNSDSARLAITDQEWWPAAACASG